MSKWTVKEEGDRCPVCRTRAVLAKGVLVVLHAHNCSVFWDREYDRRQKGRVAHRCQASPEITQRLWRAFR